MNKNKSKLLFYLESCTRRDLRIGAWNLMDMVCAFLCYCTEKIRIQVCNTELIFILSKFLVTCVIQVINNIRSQILHEFHSRTYIHIANRANQYRGSIRIRCCYWLTRIDWTSNTFYCHIMFVTLAFLCHILASFRQVLHSNGIGDRGIRIKKYRHCSSMMSSMASLINWL